MKRLNEDCYGAKVAGMTVTMGLNDMNNFLVGNEICVHYDGKDHVRKVRDYPEDIGITVKGYPFYYSDFEFIPSDEYEDWKDSDKYLSESKKIRENISQASLKTFYYLAAYDVCNYFKSDFIKKFKDLEVHRLDPFSSNTDSKVGLDIMFTESSEIEGNYKEQISLKSKFLDFVNKNIANEIKNDLNERLTQKGFEDKVEDIIFKDSEIIKEPGYPIYFTRLYATIKTNGNVDKSNFNYTPQMLSDPVKTSSYDSKGRGWLTYHEGKNRKRIKKSDLDLSTLVDKSTNIFYRGDFDKYKISDDELNALNILEDKNMNKEIKTDFDVTDEDFYLNYYTNDLKGWICVDLYKDDVSVESHFENGDYYGPENDSGSLPGGYYDRGYEIDNIDIPTEYMNELFFDEDDNEITKEEFLTLNNMDGKGLDTYLRVAKDELASEIEDYIYDHEEDFTGD